MTRHAQLEWRCRRGTRELDLMLQAWLCREFGHSSESEQNAFLELIDWPDDALIRLLLGREAADNPNVNDLAGKIRALSISYP